MPILEGPRGLEHQRKDRDAGAPSMDPAPGWAGAFAVVRRLTGPSRRAVMGSRREGTKRRLNSDHFHTHPTEIVDRIHRIYRIYRIPPETGRIQSCLILLILSKILNVTPPPIHQFLRKFIAFLMSSDACGMAVDHFHSRFVTKTGHSGIIDADGVLSLKAFPKLVRI
jgi:hypothetical protein